MRFSVLSAALILLSAHSPALADWELSQKRDGFTDAQMTIASTFYKDGLYTRGVIVRCNNRTLEAFVVFGNYLGKTLTPVRYRVDQGDVYSEKWITSNDGTLLAADEEKGLARLLMGGSSTFLVEVRDFREVSHRAQFDLSGAAAKIRDVLSSCGVSQTDISQQWPLVRREIGLDIERWGPQTISVYKRMLAQANLYKGDMLPTINEQFALAVQYYYDKFHAFCLSGKNVNNESINSQCSNIRMSQALESGTTPSLPGVSYILYLNAPSNLKQEAGSIKGYD